MTEPAQGLAFTASQIAGALGAELLGQDDGRALSTISTLDQAEPDALTFVRSSAYIEALTTTSAGAAIVTRGVLPAGFDVDALPLPLIAVDDADLALIKLLELIAPPPYQPEAGVHPTAFVDPSATVAASVKIGAHVSVGPGATISDNAVLHPGVRIGAAVTIGEQCVIHDNAVIHDRCTLGKQVVLHSCVVIGTDGFGYRPAADGSGLVKVPHVGHVEIHDDVEIGANTAVDRGKLGATVIGAGTKIDNLVQIGHNCVIGRSCIICGCCGLGGSVTLDDGVTLGGAVGVGDNLTIGRGATIGAQSGVMKSVPAGETWAGYPARPGRDFMRAISAMHKFPGVMKSLKTNA